MRKKLPDAKGLADFADAEIASVAERWFEHPRRPRIELEIALEWHARVLAWSTQASEPLVVRGGKAGAEEEKDGRALLCCDNSPALWVFAEALDRKGPPSSLQAVLGSIPRRLLECNKKLGPGGNLNEHWKVAHIARVGTGKKFPSHTAKELAARMLRFLSPANMTLVPKTVGALAELPAWERRWRELLRDHQPRLSETVESLYS